MKKFVVVVMWCRYRVWHTECVMFDDVKDAQENADLAVKWYESQGLEYDVAIYEKTNY